MGIELVLPQSRTPALEKKINITWVYLTIIPRARVGYKMVDSQRGA